VGGFGRDEIIYDGLWPMTWTPWFRSPVEYLITTVMAALASDKWNRQWLTTGDTPSDVFFLPPEWTPEEIETFALYFNQMLSGNTEKRRQTKFLPGVLANRQSLGRKDQDFEKFDLWLARRTAAIMGVQLSSIGFAGEQYKVSQSESNDLTSRLGTVSLLAMRKELYDSVLVDLDFGDLEIQDRVGPEESKTDLAARLFTSTQVAHKTVNEARLEDGLPPVPGGDVVLVPSASGFAPLSAVAGAVSDGLDDEALDVDDAGGGGPLRLRSGQALRPSSGQASPVVTKRDPFDVAQDVPFDSAQDVHARALQMDLQRWQRKCLARFRDGKGALAPFSSDAIDAESKLRIENGLREAKCPEEIKRAFDL
jgi:hypothetical protein